jgi:hypothetical protein
LPQINKISTIVIASVLKPVDDPRMFEKYAQSLAASLPASIHIIGFPTSGTPEVSTRIQLHPVTSQPFQRLSLTRLLIPIKILIRCLRLKPNVLIITTHELLVAAVLVKLLLRAQIIYDVQENYYRNIRYGTAFPVVLRMIIAGWVRTKERILKPFIWLFVLAEKSYAHEMPFLNPAVIVQNKLTSGIIEQFRKTTHQDYHRLLFSGTIAGTTGIEEVVTIFKGLHALDSAFTLTIIGHCPQQSFLLNLRNRLAKCSGIIDRMSEHPIPHAQILREIQKADVGFILYPGNPATQGSLPTKLWEYLALLLPVMIRHSPAAHREVLYYEAGILVPEDPVDPAFLLQVIKDFQPNSTVTAEELCWETEFQQIIEHLK